MLLGPPERFPFRRLHRFVPPKFELPALSLRRRPRWAWVLGSLALAVGASPAALAAGTATVSVGAVVLSNSNCNFNAPGTATLAFGTIDPASNVPAPASGSLVFKCAGSADPASFSVSHDSGLWETGPGVNRMKHMTLGEYLPYTFTLTPQSGTVPKNQNQTVAVGGSIAVVDFQNASGGSFTDTVVVTVNP
jgi:spore coat protein U-like protein